MRTRTENPLSPEEERMTGQPQEQLADEVLAPQRNLWNRMASFGYLFSAGPWIALLVLLAQGFFASLVLGLTSSIVGIILLPFAAILFGHYERWRLQITGHGSVANGHIDYPNIGFWQKALFLLKETATWREFGSMLVTCVWGVVAGLLFFLEGMVLTALLMMAFYVWTGETLYLAQESGSPWALPYSQQNLDFYTGQNLETPHILMTITPQMWWVFLLATIPALVLFAYLNGLLAATGGSLSKLILSPRPEEQERQIAKVTASRAKIMDAFEGERRRIERNLHDGVQQELVNLNLRLGLAQMEAKQLVADTQDARATSVLEHLDAARTQLTHAQNTLRDTVRGIYPAVLEDHGLKAALEELARHTVIPVHLNYQAPLSLPRNLERTAYYTVNEAVTNTLKHAGAQYISINVFVAAGSLVVTVDDNGVGGANPDRGTGLTGLIERAAALGGTVQLDSPDGGPTRLTLALPYSG